MYKPLLVSAAATSAMAASATVASDTAPQLQPQLNALAVGVDLLGHGDGFSNFTYLVATLVQNMHQVVDPPSSTHPSMPAALCHNAFICLPKCT